MKRWMIAFLVGGLGLGLILGCALTTMYIFVQGVTRAPTPADPAPYNGLGQQVQTPDAGPTRLSIDCTISPPVKGDNGDMTPPDYALVIKNTMSYPVKLVEVHVLFYDSSGQQIFGSDGAWPSATIDVGQTMTYLGSTGGGVHAPDNAATCAVKSFDGSPA